MPRSGKDTFVSFVSKYATTTNFSSVDFVKDVARFAGWNGEKDPRSRLFLSKLKELLAEYDDIPYKKIAEEIHWFKNQPEQELLFIHIREPGEIARIVRDFGAMTVLVKRSNNQQVVSNDSDTQPNLFNVFTFGFSSNNIFNLIGIDNLLLSSLCIVILCSTTY